MSDPARQNRLAMLIACCLFLLASTVTRGDLTPGQGIRSMTSTFVVTSARDAGPQTLRDAILAADRLSTRARIIVKARRITLESPLPALINPRGIDIETAAQGAVIDANHLAGAGALQIISPTATVKGLQVVNALGPAIIVNAPAVQLISATVADSKIGILLLATARGTAIRTSTAERNEVGIMAEPGVDEVVVDNSFLRANSRAGFWFVGAADQRVGASDSSRARVQLAGDLFDRNATGMVLANQLTIVRKSRFVANRESGILILGGAARVEDTEVRESGGNAISVSGGRHVVLARNRLMDNPSTAIVVRDSTATIEHNILTHNGYGIVAILNAAATATVIRENQVTGCAADAITLIGGAATVTANQLLENKGAGLRTLDFAGAGTTVKATPVLEANVLRGNSVDMPPRGLYRVPGER